MAFIGLSLPSNTLLNLLTGNSTLIGLTMKPLPISAGNPVLVEVNKVIFDPNVDVDPVTFIPVEPLGGIVYREFAGSGLPYLKNTLIGNAIPEDEFQFISSMPNNFTFFSRDAILTLEQISTHVVISGANYTPGLVAYDNSGISGNFGLLKMEVSRMKGHLKIKNGSNDNLIPSTIIGPPCPPHWGLY